MKRISADSVNTTRIWSLVIPNLSVITSCIVNAINNLYPGNFQKGADAFNMAADMEPNMPRFMSQSQLREFLEPSTKPEGFAEGGLVEYDPDHIESLAQGFDAEEFASGGAVNYNQSHIDELATRFDKEM